MKQLLQTITGVLLAWGAPGVFLVALLDSAGIPLPVAVDISLVTLGAASPKAAYFAAFTATLGSVIGSLILFWLGRRGGELYLRKKTVTPRAKRFSEWFKHYGLVTVFIPCLLPIPMPLKIFIISAGALQVRPLDFVLVVVAARVPRYFGLAYLGAHMGDGAWDYLMMNMKVLILIGCGLLLFCLLLIKAMDVYRAKRASTA